MGNLERESKRKLDNALVTGRQNLAELAAVNIGVGTLKIGVVEDVKLLRAEFQFGFLPLSGVVLENARSRLIKLDLRISFAAKFHMLPNLAGPSTLRSKLRWPPSPTQSKPPRVILTPRRFGKLGWTN